MPVYAQKLQQQKTKNSDMSPRPSLWHLHQRAQLPSQERTSFLDELIESITLHPAAPVSVEEDAVVKHLQNGPADVE